MENTQDNLSEKSTEVHQVSNDTSNNYSKYKTLNEYDRVSSGQMLG